MEKEMVFAVGDRVVHPTRGAGVVTGIESRDILEDYTWYYVLDLIGSDVKLWIPVRNAESLGLRRAVKERKVREIFKLLKGEPRLLPADYKVRQAQVEEKLSSGDVMAATEVIRDLTWRQREDKLTKRDTALLEQANEFVAGEVAVVENIELEEAQLKLQEKLEEVFVE
jgi:CarD family transcriptional regulator